MSLRPLHRRPHPEPWPVTRPHPRSNPPGRPARLNLLVEKCRQAERREDWLAAETLWRSAIVLDDGLAAAHTGLATALRRQGRVTEAEAVLHNAVTQLPPDPEHLQVYAELAHMRQDWVAAEHRWQIMREHFPHIWYSYTGGAVALREQGRNAESVALLVDGTPRFPWEPAFPQELARLAADRADWPAAEGLWRAALAFDARPWWVHSELATALANQGKLADAETVLFDAQAAHPTEVVLFAFHARLADQQQNAEEGERRWRIVRERFPAALDGYANQAEALRTLRRFDEAEAVLRDATARFPGRSAVQQALARHAEALYDWAAAAQHWLAALAIDPDLTAARSSFAGALVKLGRPDDAEAVLLDRQSSHPADIACRIAYACLAGDRADWETAATRWRVVVQTFPDRPEGYQGLSRSLREVGRTGDAAAALNEGLRRFPASEALLLEIAALARHAGKTEEALHVLTLVRQHFPRLVVAYSHATEILRSTGRFDEARDLVAEMTTILPDHWAVRREAGLLAEARDDWAGAVAHWTAMARRYPYMEQPSVRLHDALLRLAEIDAEAADNAASALTVALPDDPLRSLAMGFESLGGRGPGGGCEFGLFQRACGAEPLGLLRWASVGPDQLIACLDSRFDGIGSLETTEIFVGEEGADRLGGERNWPEGRWPGGLGPGRHRPGALWPGGLRPGGLRPGGLWDVRDTRSGIVLHTFVPVQCVPHDRLLALMRRRLAYLRDRLISALVNPAKMFVFQAADRHPTESELDDLGRAIRSYGPGGLVCILAADAEHVPGRLDRRSPGVQVGYLDFASQEEYRSRMRAWLGLCRKVRSN